MPRSSRHFVSACQMQNCIARKEIKKRLGYCRGALDVGIDLSSQSVSRQVLSALMSLTSVFGMGTGGPSSLKTPTIQDCTLKTKQRKQGRTCIDVGQALGLLVPVG